MRSLFLLLAAAGLSIAERNIWNPSSVLPRIFGRQQSSCSGCKDSEKCCGGFCISSDLPCCDNVSGGWCTSATAVCEPCPDGQTCYASNVDANGQLDGTYGAVSWNCCENSVCSFILSSGAATIVSTLSPTPLSGAPSTSVVPASPSVIPESFSKQSSAKPPSSVSSAASHRPGTTFVTLSAPPLITLPPPSMSQNSVPTPSTPTKTTSHSSSRDSSSKTSSISLEIPTTANTEALASYTTTSSSHSPLSLYKDSGPLLTGYCATYDYSLVSGPQSTALYYIPIVGCVGDKPDCCPFPVRTSTTSTVTKSITTSVTVSTAGLVTISVISSVTVEDSSPESTSFLFPTPESQAQVTLQRCPQDYETVSSGCCPSGYQLWDGLLGGVTPCYSSLSSTLVPPPLVAASSTTAAPTAFPSDLTPTLSGTPGETTSTVVNVVYAMHYPINGTQAGLNTPELAGIGIGSAFAALAGVGIFYLVWRRRRRGREWNPSPGRRTPSP